MGFVLGFLLAAEFFKVIVVSLFFRQTVISRWLALLLIISCFMPAIVQGAPVSANANLRYEHLDNDGNKHWRFDENYNLSFTKELSSCLELTSSVRYNRDTTDADNDGSRINPSLTLDLRNDIFSLILGADFNRITEESEPTDDIWSYNANWLSQWSDVWPALRFNFDQTYRSDDASPSETDTESRQFGAGFNYEWRFLECYYDYNYTTSDDDVRGISSNSERHSANLNLEENWELWDHYLTFSVGQRCSYNLSNDDVEVGAGNDYFVRDFQVRAYSAIDNHPDDGVLPVNLALTDGNLQVTAGIDIANPTELHNLGFRPETFPVNQVKIYFTDELTLTQQHLLVWEFYVSDDGAEWYRSPIAPFVHYEYDSLNLLTVAVADLPVYIARRKFGKLVLASTALLVNPVSISELEAGERRVATSDTVSLRSTFINSESRSSLTVRPLADWSINANVLYRYFSNDPGIVSKEIHASLFSDYYWNRYFSFTVGVNENRDETEDAEDEINRSYSLTINSSPLDTFDATLSCIHSEQYEGGTQTETSDSVNAYFTAQLYPEVTASLSINWNNGDESDVTWRFDSSIRLTERMNLDIYCDDGTMYGGTYNYHPSDVLTFSLSMDRDDDAESTIANSSISWLTSETVRTSLSYYLDDAPEGTDHGWHASLTWDPSQLFTIQNDINYQMRRGSIDDRDALYWSLQLSLRW